MNAATDYLVNLAANLKDFYDTLPEARRYALAVATIRNRSRSIFRHRRGNKGGRQTQYFIRASFDDDVFRSDWVEFVEPYGDLP